MYLQLRMDGYYVKQLHSDRAREFTTRTLQRWCLNRGIYKTTTAGDSPQQNGRAEKAVQTIKAKMRVALLGCGWEAEKWALACQHVHNAERSRMKPMKKVPSLGTSVLVRKRFWKSRELEPTHTKVIYVSPMPEVHGHLVMEPGGKLAITSYVLSHTMEPPEEDGAWVAVERMAEDVDDALRMRRRIRGKIAVRALSTEDGVQEEQEWLQRTRQEEVIAEESLRMITDEENTVPLVVKQVKQGLVVPEVEEEDVLRTKIVSVQDFLKEKDLWGPAIRAEMDQLFTEKKALRRTTMAELQELRGRGVEVELVPSKLVITLRPGPRRKVRIVACGNFIESRAGEELFAAGADASALRFTLKVAAEERWKVLTVDIKVAFLNAPLVTSTRDQGMVQEEVTFVLKPPSLLIKLGYAQSSEVWIAEKAMYGLRQSPRSWSIYRDSVMMDLKIDGITICQADSEPNLWILRRQCDDALCGLILVYVDDMLITGSVLTTNLVLEQIQKVWQTSAPEEVSEGVSVKFLGMEITKRGDVIRALQTAYVEDRLETNLGGDWKNAKDAWTPCPKEIDDDPEDDVQPSHIKEAQRVVGELLWLVTRTRPDLAFTTSRMAQMVLRCPRMVVKMAAQAWRYLRTTKEEGLSFYPTRGVGWGGEDQMGLEAFSDASFAPRGGTSVGAVMIRWNGGLMQWRAGRQPYPTLSAAEAELTEATEALVMGDSFSVLAADVYPVFPKVVFVDNMAAINLLTESGVWRTRHLRLRAHHMRWRIHRTDWKIAHCPGSVMIADIGTKSLSANRIKELKELMKMTVEQELPPAMLETGGSSQAEAGATERLLRMLLLATMMRVGATQPSDEEEFPDDRTGQAVEDANAFRLMMLMYTIAIVLATVIIERFFRLFVQWSQRSVAASMDPEERRRYLEEERERTYAALQSRIRRADRERREAEDQLAELEMTESRGSRRRGGGRLRRMISGSRSRTPSERSVSMRSTGWRQNTSEEDYRTEPYASPQRDDDEESQLGGSADDYQRATREDVRDEARGSRDTREVSRERSLRRGERPRHVGSASMLPMERGGSEVER